jgi:hypothetical protein
MSAPAWTPGPWFAATRLRRQPMMSVKAARIAGREPRHEVAICVHGRLPADDGECQRRLIAAAPDLYAALAGLVDAIDFEGSNGAIHFNPDTAHESDSLRAARAALARARGEQP